MFAVENVDAKTRGQSRYRPIGSREGSCHNADGERQHHQIAQCSTAHQHRQEFVALRRERNVLHCAKMIEQHPQTEQQSIDGEERKSIDTHILLRIAERAASEIFLHHVLVQSRHYNHDENAAKKLPPEGLF